MMVLFYLINFIVSLKSLREWDCNCVGRLSMTTTRIPLEKKQVEICNELNILPSNCVSFGLADESHPEFGDYDRGTAWRRVCISRLLGDCDEITI